tara:strand:- start:493 stop:855 length:363 start_codon:yes stop_codon:yes gene_type:complete
MTKLEVEQELINELRKDLLEKRIKRLEEFSLAEGAVIDRTATAKEAMVAIAELQLNISLERIRGLEALKKQSDHYTQLEKDYRIAHSALLSIKGFKLSEATVESLKARSSQALSEIKYGN